MRRCSRCASDVHDAVVIGAGPNGLVAANVLADAGWDVLVVEAQPVPGGAVRTASLTAPGFRDDVFSAFYPLAAASPVLRDLDLHDHGLRWSHAPTVLAHPLPGAPAALLHRDIDVTAASLEVGHPGDGDAYRVVDAEFRHVAGPMLDVLLRPFPPVGAALRLAARARPAGIRDLTRLSLVPLRRFLEERFGGEQAALLYAGLALHADLTPETSGSALFGWLLAGLGQQHGFPVPVGGAGSITEALVERLMAAGGTLRCGTRVDRIEIAHGRAVGVRTADGHVVHARRAVLADTDATSLLLDLVGPEHLPASTLHRVQRIERGAGTFKIDWALSAPVPWADDTVRGAGTVHLADSLDELTVTASELARHLVPRNPFVLLGQMTTSDPTRSPAGTESVWAYTHVPQRIRGDAGADDAPAGDRHVGRRRHAAIRRPARGEGGAHGTGIRRARPGSSPHAAARPAVDGRQPRRRRHRWRDRATASAARLPADVGARSARDPGAGSVPRVGLGPSRRRRARGVRCERSAGRDPASPAASRVVGFAFRRCEPVGPPCRVVAEDRRRGRHAGGA